MAETQEEHRDHRRRPVKLGVDLRLPDHPQQRGSIRELSPDGALLSRHGAPRGLLPGRQLQLGLRIPPDADKGYFRVHARVAHCSEQGIGIRFMEPAPEFIKALRLYLQQLATSEVTAERQRVKLESRREPIRAILRKASVEQARLPEGADRLIAQWIDNLRQQARKAANDEIRTRCEDDAGLLEQAWRNEGLAFSLTAQWLRPLQPNPPAPGSAKPQVTAFLDDRGSDSWLAMQTLVDALEQDFAGPLAQYRSRIALLADDSYPLPLTPPALVDALDPILDTLALSDESRLLLLRNSSKPLVQLLQPLLETLVQALDK